MERCDVLVVGAGGAGLRAAIAAHEADPALDVLLINKGPVGATGTTALAFSDRMAFHATLPHTEPVGAEAWKYHARDIFEIGGRVSDGDLAAILAQRSQEAFDYLVGLGVPFVMEDGRARQFVTDGSEYARACYTGPDTATQIEKALLRRLRETPVRVRDDVMLADVAVGENGVAGAVALGVNDGARTSIAAQSIVLCTGGCGSVYRENVYPPGMTGDGHAAAYRAGAELVNMEFIQIGLCSVHTNLACSGSIMRCVPRFVNNEDREFLPGYLGGLKPGEMADLVFAKGASWPVSAEKPSRIIDIAVSREIARGRDVFLDFSRDPEGFTWDALAPEHRARFREEAGGEVRPGATPLQRLLQINAPVVEWLAQRAIDLRAGEKMLIAPKVQHFQGGIRINHRAETTVHGLFAAGECAGGQHGANRPGGNALLDTQVFGRIAGQAAAQRAAAIRHVDDGALRRAAEAVASRLARSHITARRTRRGVQAHEIPWEISGLLSRVAAVIRTEMGLSNALRRYGQGMPCPYVSPPARRGIAGDTAASTQEVVNALTVAEMVLRAALMRDESRGPHLRFACAGTCGPLATRPDWERYIVIRRQDGEMRLEPRVPRPLPFA